ncbi:MAG: hypothetical protein UY41_C0018G0024 [Candidatus Moranbacteria bacterium GW2011_GWE1_49_15]|nr:MAG: hypothetical protein UY41_C0018G0024 [Candidatus Moranbacteria bacterium GW2011_GWE1_49_15]
MGEACAVSAMPVMENKEKDFLELYTTEIVLGLFRVACGKGTLPGGYRDGDVLESLGLLRVCADEENPKFDQLVLVFKTLIKGTKAEVTAKTANLVLHSVNERVRSVLLGKLSEGEEQALAELLKLIR